MEREKRACMLASLQTKSLFYAVWPRGEIFLSKRVE
jgi:hypothetical protein